MSKQITVLHWLQSKKSLFKGDFFAFSEGFFRLKHWWILFYIQVYEWDFDNDNCNSCTEIGSSPYYPINWTAVSHKSPASPPRKDWGWRRCSWYGAPAWYRWLQWPIIISLKPSITLRNWTTHAAPSEVANPAQLSQYQITTWDPEEKTNLVIVISLYLTSNRRCFTCEQQSDPLTRIFPSVPKMLCSARQATKKNCSTGIWPSG